MAGEDCPIEGRTMYIDEASRVIVVEGAAFPVEIPTTDDGPSDSVLVATIFIDDATDSM